MPATSRKREREPSLTRQGRNSTRGGVPRLNNSQSPKNEGAAGIPATKGSASASQGPAANLGTTPVLPKIPRINKDKVSGPSDSTNSRPTTTRSGAAAIGESSAQPATATVPQHQQAASADPAVLFSRQPRERRIGAILSHRQLLLNRIQACRIAAEQRIGKSFPKGPPPGDEVVAWKDMARQANSAAKKSRQSATDDGENKRSSVSLRRGASVGKRMNAALSSLAPGSVSAGDGGPSTSTSTAVQRSGSTTKLVPKNPIQQTSSSKTSAPPRTVLPAATVSKSEPTTKSSKRSSTTAAQRQILKQQQQQQQQSVMAAAAAAAARATSQAFPSPPYLPPSVAPPPPPLAPPPVPKVHCPEAIALREKRNNIQKKLASLFAERQKQSEKEQPTNSRKQNQHPTVSVSSLVRGPPMPPSMPQRRKTQWDYVMEEMRWLGTDFVQERKWKISVAKIVSRAVVQKARATKKASGAEGSSAAADQPPSNQINGKRPHGVGAKKATDENGEKEKDLDVEPSRRREYTHPSEEDIASAKHAAGKIATLILDAWDHPDFGGKSPSKPSLESSGGDGSTSSAWERNENSKPHGDGLKGDMMQQNGSGSEEQKQLKSSDVDSDRKTATVPVEAIPYNDISKSIQSVVDQIVRHQRQRSRKGKKIPPSQQHLTPDQLKAVEFVEFCWGLSERPSVIMTAKATPGEVEATCAALQEVDGPHLIICSPMRLFEWSHELGLAQNFRVVRHGRRTTGTGTSARVRDVVLTEYSAFEARLFDECDFETVVVDVRSSFSDFHFGKQKVANSDGTRLSEDDNRQRLQPELVSEAWWNGLASALLGKSTKRLILSDPSRSEDDLVFDSLSAFSSRQRFNLLSGVVALIFGPQLFVHPRKSILHRLLGWLDHRTKSKLSNKGEKLEVMGEEFAKLIQHFSQCIRLTRSDHPTLPVPEYRSCAMSDSQRAAYDRRCRDVRGALSFRSNTLDRESNVVEKACSALLTLRGTTVHGELDEIVNSCRKLDATDSLGKHASLDSAFQILEGSAKLRELLLILKTEGRRSVENWEELRGMFSLSKPKAKAKESAAGYRKIAVLSTSQKVQSVVSFVLGSVGISHAIVGRSSLLSEPDRTDVQRYFSALSSQALLARFNDADSEIDLVIGSAEMLASPKGGISVDCADLIVSLDEHWSGSETALVLKMLRRCLSHSRKIGDESGTVRFIRLVCEGTVEERLVCGLSRKKLSDVLDDSITLVDKKLQVWACDAAGYLVLNQGIEEKKTEDPLRVLEIEDNEECLGFTFPATTVLRLAGESIDQVLTSKKESLPIDFLSGKVHEFLPFRELEESETSAFSDVSLWPFLRELLRIEASVARAPVIPASTRPNQSLDWTLSGLATRDDFASIPSIMFMASFLRHNAPNQAPEPTASVARNEGLPDIKARAKDDKAVGSPEGWNMPPTHQDPLGSLVYRSNVDDLLTIPASGFPGRKRRRTNAYAACFSSTAPRNNKDGAQGDEILVYFPPLFSGLLTGSRTAQNLLDGPRHASSLVRMPRPKKARTGDGLPAVSSMSPRTALPVSEAEPSMISEDEHGTNVDPATTDDQDYGLLGRGTLASCASSMEEAMRRTVSGSRLSRPDAVFPIDAEEAGRMPDGRMNSVLLFVRRKLSFPGAPLLQGPMGAPVPMHSFPAMPIQPQLPAAIPMQLPSNGMQVNGKKRKSSMLQNPSAFAQFPVMDAKSIQVALGRGNAASYRGPSPALPYGGRQSLVMPPSLFESYAFRLASLRVRDRVGSRAMTTFNSSAPYRAGDKGDQPVTISTMRDGEVSEAHKLAHGQRTKLRRTLGGPALVDFGPFQVGFQGSASLGESLSTETKTGVSLPMGVKIPHILNVDSHSTRQWTASEDKLLHLYALKFGMNWQLIARELTALEEEFCRSQTPQVIVQPRKRSSRQCKERWHALAKAKPSLAKEAHRSEKANNDEAKKKSLVLAASDGRPAASDREPSTKPLVLPEQRIQEQTPNSSSKRPFTVYRGAVAKRNDIPLSLPGIAPGQNPAVVAPSHPSHQKALQEAVAGTGGREMWPLQILDLADKQRAANLAAVRQPIQPAQVVSAVRTTSSGAASRSSYAPHPTAPGPSPRRTQQFVQPKAEGT